MNVVVADISRHETRPVADPVGPPAGPETGTHRELAEEGAGEQRGAPGISHHAGQTPAHS